MVIISGVPIFKIFTVYEKHVFAIFSEVKELVVLSYNS